MTPWLVWNLITSRTRRAGKGAHRERARETNKRSVRLNDGTAMSRKLRDSPVSPDRAPIVPDEVPREASKKIL